MTASDISVRSCSVKHVAAIVLAAGRGTRFGPEPKLLASLDGKVLIRHVAEAAVRSMANPVIVVTGCRHREVQAELNDIRVQIVQNAAFGEGLSTSLKAGFAALPPESKAAVVILGDMPLVTSELIDGLVQMWDRMGRPVALVPTINGRRGNPVVLSRVLGSLIMQLSGDAGAGPILRERTDVIECPVNDPAILVDVDTSEELTRISYSSFRISP
ncbi:nucleotidyltransferase family protein [Microvirga tunisiensis]|uniref:Nucleotidyltransferase family protein n=1 Tax=Microvirga tunisiensis TaxID=2108360 RepID=A0A5N7MIF5_9HYPH|nr:nucleotidyltransferase family protein [Microvirga tunisiensis]MPR05515.1 nucleotidyltransferase family protein [Microvirga tunisiensis]MPR23716.1 nucleotidyltransferase family protein [Microvirga tunisiensis]